MNSLLCLISNNRHSLRDMAEITGTTRHRVAWFVAELERRGYISVQREWVSNISRKTNNYKVKI